MNSFDDRGRAQEKKFQISQELEFKAQARRNKRLGLWAAGLMGLSGAEADAYAASVIASDMAEAGDHDVFKKVRADFDAKGVTQSDHQLRTRMDELLAEARAEVSAAQ
jgi:hypothetical protein